MAIATAVTRESSVYVYDEEGRQLAVVGVGSRPEDVLTGYTSTTVSMRRGESMYTSDEKGRQISVMSAR